MGYSSTSRWLSSAFPKKGTYGMLSDRFYSYRNIKFLGQRSHWAVGMKITLVFSPVLSAYAFGGLPFLSLSSFLCCYLLAFKSHNHLHCTGRRSTKTKLLLLLPLLISLQRGQDFKGDLLYKSSGADRSFSVFLGAFSLPGQMACMSLIGIEHVSGRQSSKKFFLQNLQAEVGSWYVENQLEVWLSLLSN